LRVFDRLPQRPQLDGLGRERSFREQRGGRAVPAWTACPILRQQLLAGACVHVVSPANLAVSKLPKKPSFVLLLWRLCPWPESLRVLACPLPCGGMAICRVSKIRTLSRACAVGLAGLITDASAQGLQPRAEHQKMTLPEMQSVPSTNRVHVKFRESN